MNYQSELQHSLDYLNSESAIRAFEADPYWPKWDGPWWHMLLLHEVGETQQIPAHVVKAHVKAMNRLPIKIFPIEEGEVQPGLDFSRHTTCHCQLGNAYQVLAEWGVNVDEEVPWIRPWFLRYQMSDGGMTCDNSAYLVKDEVPSSMVGMIAAFEAILLYTPRPWTAEEKTFIEKGARFLIERKLMFGSKTKHNADERINEGKWLKPCFPRFYHYDVLRGLNALLLWSEKTKQPAPPESYQQVVSYIKERFPEGNIRVERQGFEGEGTILQSPSGEWLRKQPATFFPLMNKTSEIGQISPFLTLQWQKAQDRLGL